jgi:hypothetical protein
MINSSLVPHSGHRVTCTQPWCPIKAHGLKAEDLANWFVRFLAGESRAELAPDDRKFSIRRNCRSCALNVMQGKKTHLTESEWQYLDELGHRYHKRHRRREIWGNRPR